MNVRPRQTERRVQFRRGCSCGCSCIAQGRRNYSAWRATTPLEQFNLIPRAERNSSRIRGDSLVVLRLVSGNSSGALRPF